MLPNRCIQRLCTQAGTILCWSWLPRFRLNYHQLLIYDNAICVDYLWTSLLITQDISSSNRYQFYYALPRTGMGLFLIKNHTNHQISTGNTAMALCGSGTIATCKATSARLNPMLNRETLPYLCNHYYGNYHQRPFRPSLRLLAFPRRVSAWLRGSGYFFVRRWMFVLQ